jgi:hypothetical protein
MCNHKKKQMNRILSLGITILLLISGQILSQTTTNVELKNIDSTKTAERLKTYLLTFVPKDYTILDTVTGNLNLDKYPDMILVLKKNGEEKTSDVVNHPEKRPLLILVGQPDGTFKLVARNDNTVYCIDCGGMMGDPYQGITIKNGYFSVEHYGGSAWRWTRTITYKYSKVKNYWFLHKDGSESFHASEPEKVKSKTRTIKNFGKVAFDKFDIYKE